MVSTDFSLAVVPLLAVGGMAGGGGGAISPDSTSSLQSLIPWYILIMRVS